MVAFSSTSPLLLEKFGQVLKGPVKHPVQPGNFDLDELDVDLENGKWNIHFFCTVEDLKFNLRRKNLRSIKYVA